MDHPQQLHLRLDRDERAPGIARRRVGEWLAAHDIDEAVTESLLVIVSELVTNAIVHADSAPQLTIAVDEGRVRVEVSDAAVTPPVTRSPNDHSRAGGYGLRLVHALADRWGWESTGAGKLVWAETRRDG